MKMKRNMWKLSMTMIALAGITLFSSCLDNDDDFTPTPQAGLSFLHAAPGIGGVDIHLNTDKITQGAFSFTNFAGLPVKPDDYRIAFVTAANKDTIATVTDSLRDGHSYSAVLYDTLSAVKVMLFEDEFEEAQSSGAAFLRFLHLSPDNDAVSIYIDNDEFISNRHFADNKIQSDLAEFKPLSSGQFSITAIGANGDTLGQVEDAQLQGNGYYTVYLSGYAAATVDSLKVKLRLSRTY